MYAELTPSARAGVHARDIRGCLRGGGIHGDDRVRRHRPAREGLDRGGRRRRDRSCHGQHPRMGRRQGRDRHADRRRARRLASRSSSSPASPRARPWPARRRAPQRADILAADGTPLAEGPAAARSSPIGASASAPSPARSTRRAARPTRRYGPRASRPGRSPGPAGWSWPSTTALTASPAGSWSPCRPGEDDPLAGRELAGGRADAREAGQDHARPRSPGGGGHRAGRPVRRRRCTRRPRRLGEGAGGDRVLLAAATRIDVQGDHHLRGARGRAGEDDRRVPRGIGGGNRGARGRQRPRRALRRDVRASRSPSPATACSPRWASRSAPIGLSRRPRSSASTSRPALYNDKALGVVEAAREHDPLSRRDRRRPRRGRQRHRSGRGARHPAPTRLGGSDGGARAARAARPRSPRTRSSAPDAKPVEVMDAETAKTLRELMIERRDRGHRVRRRPPRRAGRRQDGHGGAGLVRRPRAGPGAGARRGARAEGGRLVHGLRPRHRPHSWPWPPWSSRPTATAATIAAPIVRAVMDAAL